MTKIKPEATLGEIGIEEKKPTYTQTPRTPTLEEAKNMERILIGTEYNNGAYVAKATYDGIPLKTNGFEKPYLALRHLMNVIVGSTYHSYINRNGVAGTYPDYFPTFNSSKEFGLQGHGKISNFI